MSLDDEAGNLGRSVKILAVIAVLFLISMIKSCEEIKYKISGRQANADIQEVMKSVGTRRSSKNLDVKYSFVDKDGSLHVGYTTVSADGWNPPEDNKVVITYLPKSPDTSIITSYRSNISFIIFLVILASFVTFCVKVWFQAQNDVKTSRRYSA